ncbi:MAG: 16S rRNA (guanine(527)-N(7))-methyltransferase RsmG [Rhizobiales bacterium]|nr:16S rRNA (guanine(527)-N(7))-methyltransferase RsmG [Hyphomicrobiales bacterium]
MGEGRVPSPPPPSAHSGVPDLITDRAQALKLTPVSRETADRLDRLVALLLEWQPKKNLVAQSTLPYLWTRHVADSLQLIRLAPDAKIWVDLGSGGGFPGLVIACAVAERPGAIVHLVESNAKKCAFLREAVRLIELPAAVHCERIEHFTSHFNEPADVVTARALAPLDRLLPLAAPLLKTHGTGLFPKGQDVAAELTAASKCWSIQFVIEPSVTSPLSSILVVRNLGLCPAAPGRTSDSGH